MINAIIMASGYGRRMGKEKLLLPFRGKLLVEHIIDKVILCGFNDVAVVSRDKQILDIASKKGAKAVKNHSAHKGQSESIKLGINSTAGASGYMFFTADQPLIDEETIKLLMDAFNNYENYIIIPCFKERKGNPVIFPAKFINELLSLEGDVGGKGIIKKHMEEVKYIEVMNEYALIDIDTEEDYKKILNVKE